MQFKLLFKLVVILFFLTTTQNKSQEELISDILSLDSLLNIKISSASKYFETSMEAPASVSILTSDYIERFGYRTFDDLLNAIRGFYISYDRNYTYLGTRGFSRPTDYNNRILLLINGHSSNEFFYGSSSLGTDLGISLDNIERVEIVRGPGSAIYGTSAMFAVINVVTKQYSKEQNIFVSGELGSNLKKEILLNFSREIFNSSYLNFSGFITDTKGNNLYFNEYDSANTNYGIANELDWDKYWGIHSSFIWGNFEIQGFFNSREKGIPTASYFSNFNDKSAKTLDQKSFIELKFQNEIQNDKEITLRTYFDNYFYKGYYPYQNLNYDKTNNKWFGAEAQLTWDITTRNRFLAGIEYKNIYIADYELGVAATSNIYYNIPFNLFSVYVQNEYQLLKNLSFTFGLRNDSYSYLKSYLTPRGSIIFNPSNESSLKFIFGNAFRVPNLYEVNYEDSVSLTKKSSNLLPEKIISTELIYEHKFSNELLGVISVYNNEIKNLIDTQLDISDSMSHFVNVGNVSGKGLELELNYLSQKGIMGFIRFSTQKSEDNISKTGLTNSPANLLKTGISVPVIKNLFFSTELIYESKRLTVYNTETESFLLINMNISTKNLLKKTKISFLIQNLLNKTYKYPGGFEHLMPAITQDCRKFNLKVTYEF